MKKWNQKIISIFLVIVTLFTFITPLVVQATLRNDGNMPSGGGDAGRELPTEVNSESESVVLNSLSNSVAYTTYVEDAGWQDEVYNGVLSGTEGQAKKLKGIKIRIHSKNYTGDIEYKVHLQDLGWQDAVKNGEIAGKVDENKRIEAIQIKLKGDIAKEYDIKYRVHVQDEGWQRWVKNGTTAGTEGKSLRMEAIQIKLTKKDFKDPYGINKREYTVYSTLEDGTKKEETHTLFYSDSFFTHSSTEYDSHLATLSSLMTYFSMNMDAPKNTEDTEWYQGQTNRISGFFETIGFDNFMANDDYYVRTRFDSIGIAIASRQVGDDTVIAVVPRSGGYYLEWGNNVWLGDGSQSDYMHEGWYNAANKLIKFLDDYVTKNNITGNIKLWMAGYSRGGATTNIAAGLLDNKIDKGQKVFSNGAKLTHNNLYAYTFEAPQGANVYSKTVKMPTDAIYNNIFNIVNPNDLVPKVAMKEWGFTRFGIDKYIYTPFYDANKYAEEYKTFSVFYSMNSNLSEYKADQLPMYGITGGTIAALEYIPLGSLELGIEYLFRGEEALISRDETKANYDSNIVSMIITEDLASTVGSRANYVSKYQNYLKEALLRVMDDDQVKSSEYASELSKGLIFYTVLSVLNEKYGTTPFIEDYDFNSTMYGLLKPIYNEHPNELITLGYNISNVFQNHEPLVTVAHMQAQDTYYVEDYNKTNKVELPVTPLFNNADLFRAEFFGFNDLVVSRGKHTGRKFLVNVEGSLAGKSTINKAERGCAVGYYSYITEEKMKLFCLPNYFYTMTMKSYSKKPLHEVSYQAYYQYFKPNGVTKIGDVLTIPTIYKQLDSYKDENEVFNSDEIIRAVNAQTGTAFGTGNIIIIVVAGVILMSFIAYIIIKKIKKKDDNKITETKKKSDNKKVKTNKK